METNCVIHCIEIYPVDNAALFFFWTTGARFCRWNWILCDKKIVFDLTLQSEWSTCGSSITWGIKTLLFCRKIWRWDAGEWTVITWWWKVYWHAIVQAWHRNEWLERVGVTVWNQTWKDCPVWSTWPRPHSRAVPLHEYYGWSQRFNYWRIAQTLWSHGTNKIG